MEEGPYLSSSASSRSRNECQRPTCVGLGPRIVERNGTIFSLDKRAREQEKAVLVFTVFEMQPSFEVCESEAKDVKWDTTSARSLDDRGAESEKSKSSFPVTRGATV